MYNGTDSVKQRKKQYNTHQHLVIQARHKISFTNRGEEFGRDIKHNLRTFRGAFLGRRHYPIIGCLQLEIQLLQKSL